MYCLRAQFAESDQFFRLVPAMIEELTRELSASDLGQLLRFRHCGVCALGHKRVERCDAAFGEKLSRYWKKQVCVVVACLVGNDCENAFAWLDNVEGLLNRCREG